MPGSSWHESLLSHQPLSVQLWIPHQQAQLPLASPNKMDNREGLNCQSFWAPRPEARSLGQAGSPNWSAETLALLPGRRWFPALPEPWRLHSLQGLIPFNLVLEVTFPKARA